MITHLRISEEQIDQSIRTHISHFKIEVIYYGIARLSELLKKTGWQLEKTLGDNPIYTIFSLKKV